LNAPYMGGLQVYPASCLLIKHLEPEKKNVKPVVGQDEFYQNS
jgi:hypothetical protein